MYEILKNILRLLKVCTVYWSVPYFAFIFSSITEDVTTEGKNQKYNTLIPEVSLIFYVI